MGGGGGGVYYHAVDELALTHTHTPTLLSAAAICAGNSGEKRLGAEMEKGDRWRAARSLLLRCCQHAVLFNKLGRSGLFSQSQAVTQLRLGGINRNEQTALQFAG